MSGSMRSATNPGKDVPPPRPSIRDAVPESRAASTADARRMLNLPLPRALASFASTMLPVSHVPHRYRLLGPQSAPALDVAWGQRQRDRHLFLMEPSYCVRNVKWK